MPHPSISRRWGHRKSGRKAAVEVLRALWGLFLDDIRLERCDCSVQGLWTGRGPGTDELILTAAAVADDEGAVDEG